jgi:hypothetical protein
LVAGRIRVSVGDNFGAVERQFERIAPNLSRATHAATRSAGAILIDALERGDNSSAEWQPDIWTLGDKANFTAHSTSDTQAYQEFGTRAHPIFARRAKALRFYWNKRQGVYFFNRVQHPGQTAKPYVQRMGEFAERGMIDEYERAWEDAFEDRGVS